MKLAVFDIDGTLVRTNRVEDACYVEAVAEVFGLEDVTPDWTGYRNVTDAGLVAELCERRRGRRPSGPEMARFREVYGASLVERLAPDDGLEIPGAGDFLHTLAATGDWCVALATGNFRSLALHKLSRAGLPCLDAPLATADDDEAREALVMLAVRRAEARAGGRTFEHVVSVGDAPWDVRTAEALGIPFVAVGTRCLEGPDAPQLADFRDQDAALAALAGVARM